MVDVYVDDKPDADHRVTHLYVWVSINDDGSEGIIASDLEILPGIVRHTPLMASKRTTAERLQPMAEKAAALARKAGRTMRIELRIFVHLP